MFPDKEYQITKPGQVNHPIRDHPSVEAKKGQCSLDLTLTSDVYILQCLFCVSVNYKHKQFVGK